MAFVTAENGRSAVMERQMILIITARVLGVLAEWWHNYRSRRELAALPERERYAISSIGDVNAEIAKPFWKK